MLLRLTWILILRPNKQIPQIRMGDGAGNLRDPKVRQKFRTVFDLEFDT